jgi:hypothetical protein
VILRITALIVLTAPTLLGLSGLTNQRLTKQPPIITKPKTRQRPNSRDPGDAAQHALQSKQIHTKHIHN